MSRRQASNKDQYLAFVFHLDSAKFSPPFSLFL